MECVCTCEYVYYECVSLNLPPLLVLFHFFSFILSVLTSFLSTADRLLPVGRRHNTEQLQFINSRKETFFLIMLTLLAVSQCPLLIDHCGQRSVVMLLKDPSRSYWMGNRINRSPKEAERALAEQKSDFYQKRKHTYTTLLPS